MLKKLQFWLTALVLMCSASAYADVVEFSNYNFEHGDAIDNTVITYDYDSTANSTSYWNLQGVPSWTASTSKNGMAGAVFAYGDSVGLGSSSYYPPTTGPDGREGKALGVVAVWSTTAYYTSEEVTLAPGNYRISIPVYNGAGTASITNLTEVTLSDGTTYSASNTTYTVGSWTTEKFYVSVSDTVTATVTLGYTSLGSGSGSNPHLFYDGVYIEPFDLVIVSPAENDEDSPYTISEDCFVVDGETTYSGITFTANIDGVEFNDDADYPYFTLYKDADSSWKGYSDDANATSNTDEFYAEYTNKYPDETGWYTAVFPEGVLVSSSNTSFTSNETSFHFYFEAEEEESGSAYTEIELANDSFDISSSWNTSTITGVSTATVKSVSGWSSKYQRSSSTHSQPAVAAVARQIGSTAYTSSYKGPTTNSTGGTDGGVLDIACGYDAYCYFYQSVTLEAGTYMLTYAAYNFNTNTNYTGDTIAVNLTGFVAEGDTVYSSLIDFPRKEWVLDTITFSLAEETTGEVRVGYQGDDNMGAFSWGPYLAYDYVSLVKVSNDVLITDDDDDDDDDDTSDSSEILVDITLDYATPAEGDTVTQLEGIYLSATLADTLWNIEAIIDSVAELITVTDSEGNTYDIEGVTIGKTDITQVAIYFEDAITDEGTYTFVIPDGLLADSVYYYTGVGHISKGGEFSYIVASADIAWTSDPADGDTLTSLSSIKIYADGGETAISSGYYNPVLYKDGEVYENISGANYTGGYYTEDWSTFTYWLNVALSDEITAEGTYTLVFGDSTIQVGDDNDNVYYLKDQLSFSWYVDGSAAPAYNVTCDPEDGSTVDSIYTFSITFNDYTTAAFSTTSAAYVYTDSACTTTYRTSYTDDTGSTINRSYYTKTVVNDGNTITMTLNYPVTEDSTYYIQLPAKRLTLDGTTLSSSDDPLIISYTVKAPQYTVVPANGSQVTQIDTIALTFPNYAKISYRTGSVYIYKDGSYAGYGGSSSRYSVSGNTIKIWFNNTPFTDLAEYSVKIPSGYVYFYDNEDDDIDYEQYLDDAIELTYTVVEEEEEDSIVIAGIYPAEGDSIESIAAESYYKVSIEPVSSVGYATIKVGTTEGGADIKNTYLTYNEDSLCWLGYNGTETTFEGTYYVTITAYETENDYNYGNEALATYTYSFFGTGTLAVLSEVTLVSVDPASESEVSPSKDLDIVLTFSDSVNINSSTSYLVYGQGVTDTLSAITSAGGAEYDPVWTITVSKDYYSRYAENGLSICVVATDVEGNRVYQDSLSQTETADYTYMLLTYTYGEEEETLTPEGGNYYFKVAGEYQYLTRGGSWGTELVLGDVGALYTLVSTGSDNAFYLESTDRKTAGFTKYYVSGPTSCYTDASSYATWSFETDDEGETWYIVNSNGNYLVGTYYSATGLTDKGYGYYYIGETSTKSDAPAFKLLSRDEYKADLAARLDEQAAAAATAAGLSATSVEEIEALGLTETDATDSITNANYASSDGWSVEQTNGNRYLTSMGYSNNVAEVWNSTGEYYQKVSGLSEGLYKVTANAFTRMTSLTTFTSNDGLIDVASVTAYLYANTSTAENISSLGFYDDYIDWANVNSTTNVNTVITASDTAWLQTLYVYVAEGDTLTLGLVANGYTEYAWNTVANWTLTLLAEEEEEEEDDDTLDVPTYDDITIDPASGSTLTSITSFSVTYENATSVNYTSYPYIYSDSACTTQVTYCKPSVSGNTVTFTAAKEVTDDGTYYIVVKDKATLDSSTTYGQDITIVYVVDSSYTGGTDDGDDDGDDDDDTTTTVTITPVTLVEGGEYETLEAGETIQFTIEPASSVGYAFYKLGTSEDGGDIKSRSTLTYNEETGYWEAEIVYDVKLDEEGIYVTVYAYASESDFNYSKDYLAYISYKIVGTAEKSVLSDVTLESITPTPTYEDENGDEVKGYLSSSENQTITLVFSDKVSIDSSTSFVNYGQGITYAFSSITASTDSTTWYLVVSASVMSAFTDGGMNITIVATDSEGNRVYSETYSESEDADYTYMNLLYYFSESTGLTNYTVSPADGETVDSLSTIVITYGDESVNIVPTWTAQITITDSTGTTTKVSLSEDYVSYDGNVITVDVSYLGLEDGTYTITIPEGFFCIEDDADSKNAEITITITVSSSEEEETTSLDGDYYFKVSGEYQYLSRGGNWGTEAIIGEYGIGVSVVSNGDGTYAFRDRDVYLASGNSRGYLTGPTGVYADGDGGDGSWTLSENEDGTYYIINSNGNYVTFDEASGTASLGNDYYYLYFSETTDVESAYAFELLTDEEYAADLAARLDEYAAAVATSAGIEAETLEDLEAAVEDEEDYSDYIANADYTSSDDWTLEQINPATYSGTFDTTNGAFEIYGAAGNLYQTISGLDEGLYKVEVNALQRQFPASYYTTYETLADVDDDLSYLYATTATSEYQTQVATWTSYEGYSDVNTIATFVEAADNYGNTLYVYVGEGEELTIGITQPDNSYYGAWTIATGWTLTLLSSETTDDDDTTVAISSISSESTFEPTAIYSVSGQLVRTQATSFEGLNKGIYIVNGQKVLVK